MADELHQRNGVIEFLQIAIAIEAGFTFRCFELVQHSALESGPKRRTAFDSVMPKGLLGLLPFLHLDPKDSHDEAAKSGGDSDGPITSFRLRNELDDI